MHHHLTKKTIHILSLFISVLLCNKKIVQMMKINTNISLEAQLQSIPGFSIHSDLEEFNVSSMTMESTLNNPKKNRKQIGSTVSELARHGIFNFSSNNMKSIGSFIHNIKFSSENPLKKILLLACSFFSYTVFLLKNCLELCLKSK